MLVIVVAVVLFIVWPEARPVILALTGLTLFGMFLSVTERARRGHYDPFEEGGRHD